MATTLLRSDVSRKTVVLTVLVGSVVFMGFCILTNSAGVYRRYFDSAIPFVYQLNSSTPGSYVEPIERAHMQWNNVVSAYWIFNRGANSSVTSAVFDGVNLVFFDTDGSVNFPPPTNTIAFSRTYTSTAGGYHAVESDLVWNARDFPPSPTGAPGAQDLQSVMAHEFGHHLGLGHQGSPGSPPGCGPTIQQAVMYGTSSSGDTSKRVLHIHDVAGVSAIYPTWILSGVVTYAGTGNAASNIPVRYIGANAASVGGVENPTGNVYERPGLVFTTEYTGPSGQYANIILDQNFQVIVDQFGYRADTANISFNPPGGIGQTQTIIHNVQLQQAPIASFAGVVRAASNQSPIQARLEFYGVDDPNGLTLAVETGTDGSYSAMLPSTERYNLTITPAAPYQDKLSINNIYLPESGLSQSFELEEAEVLLVIDSGNDTPHATYQSAMDRLNYTRRTFSVADSSTGPGPMIALFQRKPVVVWATGTDTTDALTADERALLVNLLAGGGKLLLNGQRVAKFSPSGDALLAGYLGVEYVGTTTGAAFLRGFAGDLIGNGVNYLVSAGWDHLTLVPGGTGTTIKSLYLTDSTVIAGVRVLGPGSSWGAVLFPFALEALSAVRHDTLLARSFRHLDGVVTSVHPVAGIDVPAEFHLAQNYPNPFNPSTIIRLALPEQSHVVVTVYDIRGQRIATLFAGGQPAGVHQLAWDGLNAGGIPVASGIYFYRMQAVGTHGVVFNAIRKMALVK
jgi:hypothetical protein